MAGVIATQRLAETSKAVVAKATNIVIGRTIFDRDLERAGALLGFTAGNAKALRTLADGEFLAIGPAIAGPRRIRFRAGPVVSRHKGAAPSIAPPPEVGAAEALAFLSAEPTVAVDDSERSARPMGRSGRGWHSDEDAIVVAGYREQVSVREINDRLEAAGFQRRSLSGISARARDLGLASAKAGVAWSEEEDAIVMEAYRVGTRIIDIGGELASHGFSRSRQSIQMRAIHLGLTRDRVNYWTEEETRIAVEGLNAGKPFREIIGDLRNAGFERGITAIAKFAQKHNLSRPVDPWTPEELEILRLRYEAKVPVKEIAGELGKTPASIRTRASHLGFKQRVAWTDGERRILIEAYEQGALLIDASARIGRAYPNVAAEARRMGLSFRKTSKDRGPAAGGATKA